MQSKPHKYYYLWFRLLLFRSPLLKESIFLSFPVGTKMFQFPTFPPYMLVYLHIGNWSFFTNCVSTFRYLWINGYLLLPIAFRSLSRLSSALDAKAFTLRSQQLNLITLVIQFKMFTKIIFCLHFGLIVHTYLKVCQFYLSIIFAFIYIFFNVLYRYLLYLGGGKESRTPDLLLARQALQPN